MKKILTLAFVLVLVSAVASAQAGPGESFRRHHRHDGFRSGQITRHERVELRKDAFRYKVAQRGARRDGRITPFEHRRLHNLRRHDRFEASRFRHNGRRRLI